MKGNATHFMRYIENLKLTFTDRQPITEDTRFKGCVFKVKEDGPWREKGWIIRAGTKLNRVEFDDCIFEGDGSLNCHKGPIFTTESGCEVEDITFYQCLFKGLTYGPLFNVSRGGHLKGFLISNRFTDIVGEDPERGKGAAFALNGNGYGYSADNTFENCGRHGLYVSNGGEFKSVGDSFVGIQNKSGYKLGALAVARGGNVSISGAYFRTCSEAFVLTGGSPDYDLKNVSLERSIFRDCGLDIYLNGDNPEANGIYSNVSICDTFHASSDPGWTALWSPSFKDTTVWNMEIVDQRKKRGWGQAKPKPAVWVANNGGSEELYIYNSRIITSRPRKEAIWEVDREGYDQAEVHLSGLQVTPLK